MKRNTKSKFISFFMTLVFLLTSFLTLADNQPSTTEVEQLHQDITNDLNENRLDSVYSKLLELGKLSRINAMPLFEAYSYKLLGRYFLGEGQMDSSIHYTRRSINTFNFINDTMEMGRGYTYLGLVLKNQGQKDSALVYYQKGSDFHSLTLDTLMIGIANDHMGMIYFRQGDYIEALEHMQKALDAFKQSNNKNNIGSEYNHMGLVYRKMNDKKEEEQAYLNSIYALESIDPTTTLGFVYNNLAEVLLDKGEVDKGLEMLSKAKGIYEQLNFPQGLCSYYAVLSYYYLNRIPPDYENVIKNSKKSLEIAAEFDDQRQYADATSFLGQAYVAVGRLEEAKEILGKGLGIAEENSFKHEESKILEVLSTAYEKSNHYQKALEYLRRFIILNDSIVGEDKIKQFTSLDLRFRFKHQQINDSLDHLHREEQMKIIHEKEIFDQRQTQLILAYILLLVGVISVFVYFNSRKNKKQIRALSSKNEQISKQKVEIEKFSLQVQEAFTKLHELDEYKQAMTNMLVHDLKNPLNILINLEAFQDEGQKQIIVDRTSRQMLNLVMNLLDINQAENGKMQIHRAEISLFDVFSLAQQEVEYLFIKKKVEIVNQSYQDYIVRADKDILIRVFVNLFTNAIKFSTDNTAVTWKAEVNKEGKLRISVSDKGPGIASIYHEVIFEKFKQIDPIGFDKIKSSGIGLAFCKLSVESHDWTIGVDSEPGKGASFWILIDEFDSIDSINIDTDQKASV